MSVTPSDVLFAWDASHGIVPTVGGQPSFSRGGDKWVRTRIRGGSPLYQKVVGDQLGFSWVEKDGVLLRRRALDLELGVTPENDDSVDFGTASAWAIDPDLSVLIGRVSVFGSGEQAFRIKDSGVGAFNAISQGIGTFTGSDGTASAIVEHDDADRCALRIWDSTAGAGAALVEIDFTTGTVSQSNGTVRIERLADQGPNGGAVWRIVCTGAGTSGNNRSLFFYPTGAGENPADAGTILHHVQHEELAFATSPVVYVGSPATRPAEQVYFSPGSPPQQLAGYVSLVAGNAPGQTGDFHVIIAHGDAGNPEFHLTEENDKPGVYEMLFRDADGDPSSVIEIDVGAQVGDFVELAYGLSASGGNRDLYGRVNGGTPVHNDLSGPAGWDRPSSFGSDDRRVLGERQNLDGSRKGWTRYLRVLEVNSGALDESIFSGDAATVMDELADVPIGPQRAGHV